MEKLKCGIIGTGGIFTKYIDGYSAVSDEVEIAAICDIDEKKANEIAEKYQIPSVYSDYQKLLSRPDIDFVCICLPNDMHAPVTIQALESGKHVHCEKPMAMNAEQAGQMVKAKNNACKKLMIGLNNRFTPSAMFIKDYIDQHNLGDIYFIKTGWVRRRGLPLSGWFCEKKRSGGGVLIDLGVHFIDLVLYHLNYPGFKSVTARTFSKLCKPETYSMYANIRAAEAALFRCDVEEMASGFVELQNGAAMFFELSWAANIENERNFYEIYGTNGSVKYGWEEGKAPEIKIFSRIGDQLVDIVPKINPELYNESEFKHFVNSIRRDKEPTVSIPEQGVEMMRLIDAIYLSAEQQKQIVF
jgi:predicted dehydrogenase